jgi:hypothetical protein
MIITPGVQFIAVPVNENGTTFLGWWDFLFRSPGNIITCLKQPLIFHVLAFWRLCHEQKYAENESAVGKRLE